MALNFFDISPLTDELLGFPSSEQGGLVTNRIWLKWSLVTFEGDKRQCSFCLVCWNLVLGTLNCGSCCVKKATMLWGSRALKESRSHDQCLQALPAQTCRWMHLEVVPVPSHKATSSHGVLPAEALTVWSRDKLFLLCHLQIPDP